MKPIILSILIYFISIPIGLANQWEYLGGKTITIESILINPHEPKTIYINTGKNLLKSNDAGLMWADSWSKQGHVITEVAINPQNPNNIYILAEIKNTDQLYKSTDAGKSWQLSHSFSSKITGFRINAHKPNILYAIKRGYPFFSISIDAGKSWNTPKVNQASVTMMSIEIDPQNPDTIYIAGRGSDFLPAGVGGIYKSVDQGHSWQLQFGDSHIGSEEYFSNEPIPIAINSQNSSVIYAGIPDSRTGIYPNQFLSHQLLKTTNGGKAWEPLKGFPENLVIETIAINPHNPTHVYLGTRTGVYHTGNGGQKWDLLANKVAGKALSITSIAIDPHNPKLLYIGTLNEGLYKLKITTSCTANYNSTSTKVTIPCLQIDNMGDIYKVNMQKKPDTDSFDLISIE